MDLLPLQGYVVAFLLHCVRVGAFFAVVPIFGRQQDSAMLRIALTVCLGAIFWWVGDQVVEPPQQLLGLAVMATCEAVIGFALGLALATTTELLVSAGEIISAEMGFSMARTMNPESGSDATVVSQLLQVLGFLLVLHFDIHHEALRILQQTFVSCRIGEPFAFGPLWEGLRLLVGMSVQLALQYVFPVLGMMLLLSVGMVLLGRAVPAINLMEFGFALRVLLALVAMSWFVVEATPFLVRSFGNMLEVCRTMFPN